MKTIEQIKNEVAVKYCYGSWRVVPLDIRDTLTDEVATEYAKQMCNEQIYRCSMAVNSERITAQNLVKSTPNVVTKSFVKCMEKYCSKEAVKDYNGHNHMVCQNCYECLNREFDEDYK